MANLRSVFSSRDAYDQRDDMIILLTEYMQTNNTVWRVEQPCGMETYLVIHLPGPQKLSLHVEYASNSCDLG